MKRRIKDAAVLVGLIAAGLWIAGGRKGGTWPDMMAARRDARDKRSSMGSRNAAGRAADFRA